MKTFGFVFPALRGVQAGREFYVTMCPLRLIPRIFIFDEDELKPELRSQRILNKQRVPEIASYLTRNPKNYTFSALTASIDGKVRFEPMGDDDSERNIGRLRVQMSSKFVINDGQHRRAAIEAALHENPDLGDETISVVFFLDVGLKRCQQMFADLNRHAIRPTTSLGLLYDHRDEWATIAKAVRNAFRSLAASLKPSEAQFQTARLSSSLLVEFIMRRSRSWQELSSKPPIRRSIWLLSFGPRFLAIFPIGSLLASER